MKWVKLMKKILAVILVAALIMPIIGCGAGGGSSSFVSGQQGSSAEQSGSSQTQTGGTEPGGAQESPGNNETNVTAKVILPASDVRDGEETIPEVEITLPDGTVFHSLEELYVQAPELFDLSGSLKLDAGFWQRLDTGNSRDGSGLEKLGTLHIDGSAPYWFHAGGNIDKDVYGRKLTFTATTKDGEPVITDEGCNSATLSIGTYIENDKMTYVLWDEEQDCGAIILEYQNPNSTRELIGGPNPAQEIIDNLLEGLLSVLKPIAAIGAEGEVIAGVVMIGKGLGELLKGGKEAIFLGRLLIGSGIGLYIIGALGVFLIIFKAEPAGGTYNPPPPDPGNPGENPAPNPNPNPSPDPDPGNGGGGSGDWQSATTLYDYYKAWDKSLPAFSIRAQFYEILGLGSAGSYVGSAEQNTVLLNALKDRRIAPTTVEELNASIGPPPLAAGVEDTNRTSRVAWSFTEYNGEFIAVHTGENDGKIYLLKRSPYKEWTVWRIVPDCWTDSEVSIAVWKNNIVLAFRGGDDKIWVGMYEDGVNWTGWRYTERTCTFGPVLASDGNKLYLVHRGSGNARIYWSANMPWFTSGWNDTLRDTTSRPAAAAYMEHLYIAHKGANNTEIYYADVTANSPWYEAHRTTNTAPGIAVQNGFVIIAHQGLNDNKNYISIPSPIAQWSVLQEQTSAAPFIAIYNNMIGYAYLNNRSMRLQWPDTPEECYYTGPESGVNEVGRSTKVSWCFTDYKGQIIGAHTGRNDGKIYLIKKVDNSTWQIWRILPDCWTEDEPTIATWGNHLVIAFTGGDGKIWVGMLENGDVWSGWRDTRRTSYFGPVLASDGANLFMVHKGSGNDRIYWSADAPWFVNNWQDTVRDTRLRPAAAAWNSHLYIAHKGAWDNEIYYKDMMDNLFWQGINRQTHSSPSIAVLNGSVYIAHQGLADSRNYIGRVENGYWTEIKEATETISAAPFVGIAGYNLIGHAYVHGFLMRFQWFPIR